MDSTMAHHLPPPAPPPPPPPTYLSVPHHASGTPVDHQTSLAHPRHVAVLPRSAPQEGLCHTTSLMSAISGASTVSATEASSTNTVLRTSPRRAHGHSLSPPPQLSESSACAFHLPSIHAALPPKSAPRKSVCHTTSATSTTTCASTASGVVAPSVTNIVAVRPCTDVSMSSRVAPTRQASVATTAASGCSTAGYRATSATIPFATRVAHSALPAISQNCRLPLSFQPPSMAPNMSQSAIAAPVNAPDVQSLTTNVFNALQGPNGSHTSTSDVSASNSTSEVFNNPNEVSVTPSPLASYAHLNAVSQPKIILTGDVSPTYHTSSNYSTTLAGLANDSAASSYPYAASSLTHIDDDSDDNLPFVELKDLTASNQRSSNGTPSESMYRFTLKCEKCQLGNRYEIPTNYEYVMLVFYSLVCNNYRCVLLTPIFKESSAIATRACALEHSNNRSSKQSKFLSNFLEK